ncbi:MAG: extracellular solute-binding protein [Acutalibacter sp.]|nr:extracellular solute-binding protein [Acutalibacter sp.]
MKKVKVLAALLAALLTLSACTSTNSGSSSASTNSSTESSGDKSSAVSSEAQAEDSNFNETGYPIVNEKITITGFGNQNVTHKDWQDVYCFTKYEELSNIHIEWTTAPNQGYAEKKNVLLAGGEYPDIFYRAGLSVGDQVNYGSKGLLVPMNDLIDQYAPNLTARFEEVPDMKKCVTMPDGNIYTLPSRSLCEEGTGEYNWINTRWLENVNMEMPTTLAELEAVLVAFKEQDANGNGDPNDEIPYSDRASGKSILHATNGSFGIGSLGRNVLNSYLDLDESGKIRMFAVSDNFKAQLQWVNGLYSKGLIDPEMFTQDIPTFTSKGEQDLIGAVFHNNNPEIIGAQHMDEFKAAPPLANEDGTRVFNNLGTTFGSGAFAISSTNPYPKESMRWIDYYYGEEGAKLLWLGEEGVTYIDNGDGTYAMTEYVTNNPDGLNRPQAIGQYAIGFAGGGCPVFTTEAFERARLTDACFEAWDAVMPYYQVEGLASFSYTTEEQDRLNALSADIVTYVDEMKVQFITGKQSFDQWDSYVKNIENMGLEEYVQIQQAAYERWANS